MDCEAQPDVDVAAIYGEIEYGMNFFHNLM
jgi:hypothetical protein